MNIHNRTAQDRLVHVLKIITGFGLCKEDIISSVSLITALGIVLLKINAGANNNKKQYLQEHLYKFSDVDSVTRQITDFIVDYIQESEVETSDSKLLIIGEYLSKQEKLLLVIYAYSLSTIKKKNVIQDIAKSWKIETKYLQAIEKRFCPEDNCNLEVLQEVKELLNSNKFRHLDIAVSNVAKSMLTILDKPPEKQIEVETASAGYEYLQQYQRSCKQLDKYCDELYQIIDECKENNLVSDTFISEIENISHQLQSQNFRVAVVGEFSQGKSTLLNALLKEEIQPVRAIPCSGTVTVLKYGKQKRVVCRYKDGREEEIPLEQYHEKAAISEAAALDGVSDELAISEIKEIVFEHPDLELCRHGVEIVDSPGLNEHPERSAITEQLIEDTDAIIFLTNASRLLTQGERELINELKIKINGGNSNTPANNLFMVVNFMDLLRRETDRVSVKEKIERFAYSNNPIIEGDNRIHFISAQAALDAIQEDYEDEYLNSFNSFTESIETFLTDELGSIKLNHNVSQVKNIIRSFKEQQEEDKQEILEEIGVVSYWDVELYQLIALLEEEAIDEAVNSWNEWMQKWPEEIYEESEQWMCDLDDEDRILKFFSEKLHNTLIRKLNNWLEHKIRYHIIKKKCQVINSEINSIIEALQDLFQEFDNKGGTNITEQIEISMSKQQISLNIDIGNVDEQEGDGVGFGFGLGSMGLIGAGLFAFTGIGLVPIALTALGSGLGLGALFGESKQDKIKRVVLEKGLEQFYESEQETFDKISQQISLVFENKVKFSSQLIKEAIAILESLLEVQTELEQKNERISKIDSDINIFVDRLIKQPSTLTQST